MYKEVEAVCRFLDKIASLGMNMMMLYTEDTYEVEGYPTFGYMRGRDSPAELRAIDDYAASLGIEVIPWIQTPGHLLKFTRWKTVPSDVPGILLAGDEEVYRLITAEIRVVRSAFRSSRIHLGMDEAKGMALGEYRKQHGEKPPLDVFNAHLRRVREIAHSFGYTPMIWTDMYYSESKESVLTNNGIAPFLPPHSRRHCDVARFWKNFAPPTWQRTGKRLPTLPNVRYPR